MSARKNFLRPGRIVVVTLALLGLSCLLLYFLVKTSHFRMWLESELGQRTGYQIRIGDLEFSLPLQVVASEIAVVKSDETLLRAQALKIGLSPLDLFSGSLHSVQLEKPVVQLSLDRLIQPEEKSWPRLTIRTLTIRDGELLLQTREGKSLEFRSINLATKKLTLGQDADLEINADLPWLEAKGHIRLHGPPGAREAEFQVRQWRKRDLSELWVRKDGGEGVLKGRVLLKEKSDGIYAISASADFHKFKVWVDSIHGQLESQIELDTDKREASFVAHVSIPQFPSKIGRMAVPIPLGSVTGNFQGYYALSEKRLEIAALKLESSLGNVQGKMAAFFGDSNARIQGELDLNRVSITALTPYFPALLRQFDPKGSLNAKAFLSGPWNSPRVKGVVRSEEVRLQSAKASFARLSFEAPFEWDDSALTARGARIRAEELKFGGEKSYQFEASEVDLAGELEMKKGQPVKISGQARLSRGRFASPDQSKLGENFATSSHFTLIYHPLENRSVVRGQIAIERGEFLWGKFFGDLRRETPSLDFSGAYLANTDELQIDRLGLALRSVGSVVFKGNLRRLTESPAFEAEARTEDVSLGGVYDFFFRDTFKRTYPVVDQLRLGGRSKWVVRAAGSSEAWSAEGSVELENAEIEPRSNAWQIGPIGMVLPFQLRYPMAANTQPGGSPKTGSLEIQAARVGSTKIPPVKTALSFWNNSLRLSQPLRISIYGGTVLLKDLAWKDIIKEPAGFSFSLDLQDVQLLPLTQALDWYRFGGTITGSISQIESIADSLRSRGGMELRVFGGRVIVKEMEIRNPFSWLRSFKLDARLEAIELERASETFEFGRISGILEGTIDDLVMTQGQPSQFRADIHTVDRSGASQWISVEALNKISVISSGNDAGFLYRGLAGFFENFRYSKLGFKAALKNDRLVLRGIESKEGKEFLVVGSLLPPTVNIISHTQEIGFSELLRRLKRVSEAGKPEKSRPN